MDYETLKEQWNDVEERDGVRLSWNTFPSSRMVIHDTVYEGLQCNCAKVGVGSFAAGRAHRRPVYSIEREGDTSRAI